mmetsp:Transcript_95438/g.256259  ORF Transcript_95438/g.256259 Transcript_95438/m.256259 type:complete len:402 (-) Transcript_95438:1206-2411(-)
MRHPWAMPQEGKTPLELLGALPGLGTFPRSPPSQRLVLHVQGEFGAEEFLNLLGHVVADHQHRGLGEGAEGRLQQRGAGGHVQVRHRLVQRGHPGAVEHQPRKREARLLPGAEREAPVPPAAQAVLEQPREARDPERSRDVLVQVLLRLAGRFVAIQREGVRHGLAELPRQGEHLRGKDQHPLRPTLHGCPSLRPRPRSREGAEEGALPGSAGPTDQQPRARWDGEAQALQQDHPRDLRQLLVLLMAEFLAARRRNRCGSPHLEVAYLQPVGSALGQVNLGASLHLEVARHRFLEADEAAGACAPVRNASVGAGEPEERARQQPCRAVHGHHRAERRLAAQEGGPEEEEGDHDLHLAEEGVDHAVALLHNHVLPDTSPNDIETTIDPLLVHHFAPTKRDSF